MGALVLAEGGKFVPPDAESFVLPPIFGSVTKPMLLVAISAVIVGVYFVLATRNLKLVPSKAQFAAESIYDFTRNTARDHIGSKDFKRYIPLIFALFTFVLVNNLFGIVPFVQFPTMSHIGFPLALLIVVYVTYHGVGIKRHGLLGYLKHVMFPPGVPKPIYVLLAPIEFFSKFVTNPFALAIRVFAAMFAGHLILLVFTAGGEYLLVEAGAGFKPVSVVSFAFAIALTFVEALIQVLQAYIFALLSASYIGSALAQEH